MKLFVVMNRKGNEVYPLYSTFSENTAKKVVKELNNNRTIEEITWNSSLCYYMSTNFLDKECKMKFK